MMINVGVLGAQGDISEHVKYVERALAELGIQGVVKIVKAPEDLDVDGLIIPGGESTTIIKFLHTTGLYQKISTLTKAKKLRIMGTCAGAIAIADTVVNSKLPTLKLIPMTVLRNAYGRQINSFETLIKIKDLKRPFKAVFIRAPKIIRVAPKVEILAASNDNILFVRYQDHFALTFHPELSGDTFIHKMFINVLRQRDTPSFPVEK